MAKRYLPVDRSQPFLLPPSVQEFVPEDDLSWFLIDAVAAMDTAVFHRHARLGGVGRPGYDPAMLLTLLVYAYCLGVRSSRKIEQLCVRDLGFKVVTGNRVVDHSTIAQFRQVHQDAVVDLFTQVLLLCAKAGLDRVGLVAVDGTKMAAAASMSATRKRQTLAAERDRLSAEVAAMLAEATGTDAAEDALFGPGRRGDELPAPLRRKAGRLARLQQAIAQIDAARDEHDTTEHPTEHDRRRDGGRDGRSVARRDQVATARRRLQREITRRDQRLAKEATAGRRLPGSRPDFDARIAAAQTALDTALTRYAPAQPSSNQPSSNQPPQPSTDLALRPPQPSTDLALRPADPGTDLPGTDLALRPGCSVEHLPSCARKGNSTDPDSRILKARHGFIQGYNAQVAAFRAHGHHIVLAAHVTQDTNDVHQATPMMHAAVTNATHAGMTPIGVLVFDAGYWSHNNLTTPGPDRLIAPTKNHTMLAELRTHGYTTGPPAPDATPAQAMRHRLKTEPGAHTYAQRASTVEPVFGNHKHNRHITNFHRRGLAAADSEWKLIHATGNLTALHRHHQHPPTRHHPT